MIIQFGDQEVSVVINWGNYVAPVILQWAELIGPTGPIENDTAVQDIAVMIATSGTPAPVNWAGIDW
jgi:hypothetical protein